MSKGTTARSALEELALEDTRRPKDFDPEALHDSDDSASDDGEDVAAGREHYEGVGKSKLRKSDIAPLGPQYAGSRISRNAAEDSDSDDPFAREMDYSSSSEDDAAANGISNDKSDGSDPEAEDEDMDDFSGLAPSDASREDIGSESEDDLSDDASSASSVESAEEDDSRKQIRDLLAKSQSTITSNIAQAASAEAAKGRAIKSQRSTFDALLNARIRLQKGLVAANSFSFGIGAMDEPILNGDAQPKHDHGEVLKSIEAAEAAATSLLTTLSSLRTSSLSTASQSLPEQTGYTIDTPSQSITSDLLKYHEASETRTAATLTKWATKTRPTGPTTQRRQLASLAGDGDESGMVENLQSQLAEPSRLIARARTARSCAPLQAAAAASNRKTGRREERSEDEARRKRIKVAESEVGEVYDDADFYALLLSELLSRHSGSNATADVTGPSPAEVSTTALNARNLAKTHRAGVDVRASKGRKLKYGEHEKLVDFMAPEERGSWNESRRRDLFAGLFGIRGALEEEDDEGQESSEPEADGEPMGGLRLFG